MILAFNIFMLIPFTRTKEVTSPGVAAVSGFVAQAKLVRFVSAGASAFHIPLLLVLI